MNELDFLELKSRHAGSHGEYARLLVAIAKAGDNADAHADKFQRFFDADPGLTAKAIRQAVDELKRYFSLESQCTNEMMDAAYRKMDKAEIAAADYNNLPDMQRGIKGTFYVAKERYEKQYADRPDLLERKMAMINVKSERVVRLKHEAVTEFCELERDRNRLDKIAAEHADVLGGLHVRWTKPDVSGQQPVPTRVKGSNDTFCTWSNPEPAPEIETAIVPVAPGIVPDSHRASRVHKDLYSNKGSIQ